MTYKEALDYINSLYNLGSKLGLSRIGELLSKLGEPQKKLKCIHVAGTNGKGSTCAMLSSVLAEAGYTVGMYTSPHLVKYNERFSINGKNISDEDFAKNIEIVSKLSSEMKDFEEGQPTIFEILTAVAFNYFSEKKVDYVVLEVGMGGRFDATNIIDAPVLSVITSISMDHMEHLGYEISEIAAEKGGIIKAERPVVLYKQDEKVYNVINNISKTKNARLYYPFEEKINVLSYNLKGTQFAIENEYFSYDKVELGLLGEYQLHNAALVLLCCHALKEQGISISDNAVLNGIKHTKWSGRMEVCGNDPLVLLDGAHNIDGISMLANTVREYFKNKKITLLMGVLGDKEYEKMAEILIPLASRLVLTEPASSRALDAKRFEDTASAYLKPVFIDKNIKTAFLYAKSITKPDEVLICSGSLYLIGELKKIISETE